MFRHWSGSCRRRNGRGAPKRRAPALDRWGRLVCAVDQSTVVGPGADAVAFHGLAAVCPMGAEVEISRAPQAANIGQVARPVVKTVRSRELEHLGVGRQDRLERLGGSGLIIGFMASKRGMAVVGLAAPSPLEFSHLP